MSRFPLPRLSHLLPWSLDNVISLRTVHAFALRAGGDTGDHLAVSVHFTNRKVRFREAVSFVQGPQPVSGGAEGRTQLPSSIVLHTALGGWGAHSSPWGRQTTSLWISASSSGNREGVPFSGSHTVLYSRALGTCGRGGGLASGVLGAHPASVRTALLFSGLPSNSPFELQFPWLKTQTKTTTPRNFPRVPAMQVSCSWLWGRKGRQVLRPADTPATLRRRKHAHEQT